jgi:hypothetical protein
VTACNGVTAYTGYIAYADPATVGVTGTRYFGTNTTSTIWQSSGSLGSTIKAADTTVSGGTPIQ